MITHKEDYMTGFNPEAVTLQDCIDNYEKKNRVVVISDGKCVGFVKEISISTVPTIKKLRVAAGKES